MNEFKVVCLGGFGINSKTSLISKFVSGIFEENLASTTGASYASKVIATPLGNVNLNIWDTAWQEKYLNLTRFFYKECDCVILGYDVTCKSSFDNDIKNYYYNKIISTSKDILIYLVGTKIDCNEYREVSTEEGIAYSKEKGIKFYEVSSKTGENVQKLFEDIAITLLKKKMVKERIINKKDDEENDNLKPYVKILKKFYNF